MIPQQPCSWPCYPSDAAHQIFSQSHWNVYVLLLCHDYVAKSSDSNCIVDLVVDHIPALVTKSLWRLSHPWHTTVTYIARMIGNRRTGKGAGRGRAKKGTLRRNEWSFIRERKRVSFPPREQNGNPKHWDVWRCSQIGQIRIERATLRPCTCISAPFLFTC
jgi:hypothetical protein